MIKKEDKKENTNYFTLLLHSGLPHSFWVHAALVAAYIRNRCTTKAIIINADGTQSKRTATPYELLTGKCPNVSNLVVFGSDCFIHIDAPINGKLSGRSSKGIIIGYADDFTGYKCYDIEKDINNVIFSRNVKINENEFKHSAELKTDNYKSYNFDYSDEFDINDEILLSNEIRLSKLISLETNSNNSIITNTIIDSVINECKSNTSENDSIPAVSSSSSSSSTQQVRVIPLSPIPEDIIVSDSIPTTSISVPIIIPSMNDTISAPTIDTNNIITGKRIRSTTNRYQMVDEKDIGYGNTIYNNYLLTISTQYKEPNNYKEAMSSPHKLLWLSAMEKEYLSLTNNNTWKLVQKPSADTSSSSVPTGIVADAPNINSSPSCNIDSITLILFTNKPFVPIYIYIYSIYYIYIFICI